MKLVVNKTLKSAPVKVNPVTKELSVLQHGVWKPIRETDFVGKTTTHGIGRFDAISLTGEQLHKALTNLTKEGLNVSYDIKQYGETYILYLT